MTGFGAAQGTVEGVEYAVAVRAVNNRYFKANVNLPDAWAAAEADFERTVRQKLARGSITLTVRMKLPDDQAAYQVNQAALARYVEQLRGIGADPMLRVDLAALLELPGVCEPPPLEELLERTQPGLAELVDQALDALVAMRQREGQEIQDDLLANCDVVDRNLAVVIERSPGIVRDYQERLTARVAELTNAGNIDIDADSLAREVAVFAERCDVAEEISRLGGHVKQFRAALEDRDPVGRKLDFIAQEMLREANTIASKANDSQIARAMIEVKTAIDRIKEQVQNVE